MTTTPLTRVPPKNVRGIMTYVKPEVYDAIKEIAELEDRTMSNLVARIVTEWVVFRQKSDS